MEASVEKLIGQHGLLRQECARLTRECTQLRAERRELQEKVRALENELSLRQLGDGLAGGNGDKAKARARINRLMREVDKCIALVENDMKTTV